MADDLKPPPGVRVDTEALTHETRFAGYAMVSSTLRLQRILTDHLNLRPTEATIFLTIVLSTTQRYVRRPPPDEALRGAALLPDNIRGSISRRAVAAATGLPRETVRRTIDRFIETGLVIEVGRNAVTSRLGELLLPGAAETIEMMAAEAARLFDTLTRHGVLVER